ncbi:MAG TPA: DUF3018 family protein [Acidiferrobacteraceae bacterium]|nr:DUF3018 family protein [Acidiferrobacteraceae bacterium]
MSIREKVRRHRNKLKNRGLRPVQIWVPDTRSPDLAKELRRQSILASTADSNELMDALDINMAETEGWRW